MHKDLARSQLLVVGNKPRGSLEGYVCNCFPRARKGGLYFVEGLIPERMITSDHTEHEKAKAVLNEHIANRKNFACSREL